MNYKPLIPDTLKKYFEEFPEYTIGDILYSCLTQFNKGESTIRKIDLRTITEEEFYKFLSKSMNNERN